MIVTVTTTDAHYLLTTHGSSDPQRLIESYFAEADVRAKWWRPQAGEVVFDVGAGSGSYTLPALAAGATVLAFEPGREEFFDLHTQVMLNGYRDRAFPYNCLVGSKGGVNHSYCPANHSCGMIGWPRGKRESRLVQQIDDMRASCRLPRFDWLKIDVEGAELDVLAGAKESLKEFHPLVLLENHEGFVPGARDLAIAFFMDLERGWEEERIARPSLGQNADWSLWAWKGES